MAVTLPTFADVGIADPRSVGSLPTYPQNDAGAEGEAALGKGIEKAGGAIEDVAAYRQMAQNRNDRASADADFTMRYIPLIDQIRKETDPAKITELTGQLRELPGISAQAIGDPAGRDLWLKQNAKHVATGLGEAQIRQTDVYRDQYAAGLKDQMQQLARVGAASDDSAGFELSKANIAHRIQAAQEAGAITALHGQALRSALTTDLVEGRIDSLIAKGRTGEAKSLLDQNRLDLGAARAGNLEIKLQKLDDKKATLDLTNGIWGGKDSGRAGNLGGQSTDGVSLGQMKTHALNAGFQGADADKMAALAMVESSGNPRAHNPNGEDSYGLTQINAVAHGPVAKEAFGNPQRAFELAKMVYDKQGWDAWKNSLPGAQQYLANGPIQAEPVGRAGPVLAGNGKGIPSNVVSGGPAVEVWGDSLGVGLKGQLKVAGTVHGGDSPTTIFENIQDEPEDSWQGKTVVLPSGSNGNEMPVVEDTIKYLQGHGAKVIAVGYGPKFPAKNAELQKIAERQKVQVVAAEDVASSEGVHPSPGGYKSMANKIRGFAAQAPDTADAGGAVPAAITDAPPAQSTALAPLPDIEEMTQRVQDMAANGQITQERANAVEGQLRSRYNHVQSAQASQRASLAKQLQNGAAMLADGGDFDYDPAAVRHFFPKEKADEILQQLQDAKDGGQIVAGVRTASPDQIEKQRVALEAGLNDPKATDYAKRRVIAGAFQKAVNDQQAALIGPKADPVAYLAQYSPIVQQKRAAIDPKNPQTFQDYATTVLSEQERMGVPPEMRHILTTNAATQISAAIATDPEHAPDTMRAVATQYGQAWPNVWGDLITAGKLPAGYQVVGQLADYDQTNASVLARSLGASAKDDKTFKSLVSSKAPGGKSIEDVTKQTIPTDSRIVSYERSLVDSGASPGQVVAIRSAVEHLAAGRAIFMHEDPSEATEKAIDAVVGHYDFMPNGGARVPKDKFEAVSANAQAVRNGLSVDNVAVPALYGSSPALPKPQEYIDMVRAAPAWITGPKADRLLLLDAGGRLVTGKDGVPIAVPFDAPNVAPPRVTPPFGGPF